MHCRRSHLAIDVLIIDLNVFRRNRSLLTIAAIIKCVPQPCCDVIPVTLKMSKFNQLRNANRKWFSDGFYTSPGGYKVRLIVCPNGSNGGEPSCVSVFINLMPGDNDDNLEFPMLGRFNIEILNQMQDAYHYKKVINVTSNRDELSADEEQSRMTNSLTRKHELDNIGFGSPNFITRSSLDITNSVTKYVVGNIVYFRVKAAISQTKSWLVSTFH